MPGRKRQSKLSDTAQRFAARLRELRRTQGLTQLDLAGAAGISLAYVGRLEAGSASCTLDVLEKIARALAVGVTDLLPSAPPPDTTAHLRQRVRSLADRLVQSGDRETLALAAQFLARLSE